MRKSSSQVLQDFFDMELTWRQDLHFSILSSSVSATETVSDKLAAHQNGTLVCNFLLFP